MSDTRFRLVVMGDSYVGKSSIIKRFLFGTFSIDYVFKNRLPWNNRLILDLDAFPVRVPVGKTAEFTFVFILFRYLHHE